MKKNIKNNEVISPCISICRTDPRTGYCYGCARTDEEKKMWKNESTKLIWKKENLKLLIQRMSGWQLETFQQSYSNKIKTGLSLYKQNIIKINDEK
tara:strand:+ start:72 stop:359 length:288 start_codon:yes stop_codon:yes gene_type:complete